MNDLFARNEQRRDPMPQQQQFTTNYHYPVMEGDFSQPPTSNSYNHHHHPNSVTTVLQQPAHPHRSGPVTTATTNLSSMETGNGNPMRRTHPQLSNCHNNNNNNNKIRNDESINLVELLSPSIHQQPLSRSSSLGSMLDWDISMMNTTPLALHPKPTVSKNMNLRKNDNNNTNSCDLNSRNYLTTQSETSKSFHDFAPLPFNESSEFDGNTLSFLSSIGTSNSSTGSTANIMNEPHSSNIASIRAHHVPISDSISPAAMNIPVFPTQELKRKISREEIGGSSDKKARDQPSDMNVNTYCVEHAYDPDKMARVHPELYSGNRLMRSNAAIPSSKKIKSTEIAASLLHNTCKLFPTSLSVIESAVQFDPEAIHTAIPTLCSTKHTPGTSASHDFNKNRPHQHSSTSSTAAIRDFYSFPLNIALQHNASLDVIAFLLQLYPSVLTKIDGPNQTGSLSIALSSMHLDRVENSSSVLTPTTTKAACRNGTMGAITDQPIGNTEGTRIDQLIRMFILANPDCVKVIDRRKNTVLHYLAKRQGDISCESISMVYQLYPEALNMRNCLGQTPVQVAQRNPTITDKLLDHWYEYSYREQEMTLEKSLIQIDHELDESNQKTPPMDFGPAHDVPLGGCGSRNSTSCATRAGPTTTTQTTSATAAVPTATKASNASAYFVPSVLASSKKNYDKRQ